MLEAGAVSSDKDKLTENRFIYESGNRTIIEAVFYHANDLLPDEKVFLQPAQAFPMYIKNILYRICSVNLPWCAVVSQDIAVRAIIDETPN